MIVVTGPTGNTGGLVVEGLKRLGIPFRAMTRSEDHRRKLEAQGVAAVIGDFERPDTLRAALDGADKAYLVCTPDERLVRCEPAFIEAARAAGVKHLVKCGAYATGHDAGSPNLRMHAVVEDALRASGLTYTIIRPHGFMQTFFWMTAPFVVQQGLMIYPAADGPIPLIDVRDVGEAMLKALTEPGYENREINLTGPAALRPSEMAVILSRAMGREIRYMDAPEEGLDAAMRQMGVPDAPREHVLWCFREQRAGRLDYVSREHEALGLRLRSYEEFAADLAAGKTGTATSEFAR